MRFGHAQQLGLGVQRQLTDFTEKQRAAVDTRDLGPSPDAMWRLADFIVIGRNSVISRNSLAKPFENLL